MSRLPTPGGDDNTWGSILNDYLSQSLNADGSLKTVARASLDSSTQASLGKADTAVQTVNGKSGSAVTLTANDVGAPTTLAADSDVNVTGVSNNQVLTYDTSSSKWIPATVTSTTVGDATTSSKGIIQLAGDLGGNAAAPSVAKVNGISVSGTPSSGQALLATSSSAAAWGTLPSAPVSSVAGKTGAVTLVEGDIASLTSDLGGKVNLSTATTKGDLLAATGNATLARVGVGSDGQVLTADSTQTTGLKWATSASGPSKGFIIGMSVALG